MGKTTIILALFLFFSWHTFAQKGVFDAYNHVIIPIKFQFQEANNEYQLNSLLRHLFKEDGFTVFMDVELLPYKFQETPCKKLNVDLHKMQVKLQTTITIQIFDCEDQMLFTSEGVSYQKDNKTAYQEAIRMAFKEIESANFSLQSPSLNSENQETKSLSKEERIEMRKQTVRDQSDVFEFDGKTLYFFPVDENIHIYESNAYDITAKLTPINETMFIYNSKEIDGVMTRKENGDFELEYREPALKETKIVRYKLNLLAD